MGELISYEELRKVQNLERDNKALQNLDSSFFDKVKEYISTKKKLLYENEGKDNSFAYQIVEKCRQELGNIDHILDDICLRRQKKVMMQAITNITAKVHNTDAMIPEEEEIYNSMITLLKDNQYRFLSKFEQKDESIELKKDNSSLKLLRILDAVPSFVWRDGKNYGPFQKEDVLNLPLDVGEILINQGKASEIVEDKGGAVT